MGSYCFYFLQGTPGESWSSPNAFKISHSPDDPITLYQVKSSFPLASVGSYHWRFRVATKEGFEWKDVKDENEQLPRYQGVVFAKILR